MFASAWNRPEAVKQLLGARANVNAPGYMNETALDLATREGHSEVIDILKGADGISSEEFEVEIIRVE